MQQPPRGGTWVGSTCDTSETRRLQFLSGGSHEWGSWAWASVRVSVQYRKIQLEFRTPVLIGREYG
ncbi:hypothetical protein V1477_010025 [Vespula maculifrons]|uniref:Uncharacterized protein n=1 Tax=Vespula maculifrons TaxID=7453 RepID=A0ABD2CBF7_VESMC